MHGNMSLKKKNFNVGWEVNTGELLGRHVYRVWTEYLNFMMGSSGGQLWIWFYHKMKILSWLVEQMSDPKEISFSLKLL